MQEKKRTSYSTAVFFPFFLSVFNCKCKDLQGGILCGPVFLQFFQRILIKKTVFFEQGKVFDLAKVCFVFAFEKHAITI